jgi:hypothetical protein
MTAVLPVRIPSKSPATHDAAGDPAESADADAGRSERFWEAVVAARRLLVGTADAVDPDTSAATLLDVVKDYRASLAELVAVLPVPGDDDV